MESKDRHVVAAELARIAGLSHVRTQTQFYGTTPDGKSLGIVISEMHTPQGPRYFAHAGVNNVSSGGGQAPILAPHETIEDALKAIPWSRAETF